MPTADDLPQLRRRDLRAYRSGAQRRRGRRRLAGVVATVVGVALLGLAVPPLLSGDTPLEAVAALPARLVGLGDLAARGADQAARGADGALSAIAASRSGDRRDAVPSPSAMASADAGPAPTVTAAPAGGASTSPSTPPSTSPSTPPSTSPSTPPSTEPSTTPSAPAVSGDEVLATRLVALTNAERATVGLPPLETSSCATDQAVARAAGLVAEGRFEHDPLGPVLVACGGGSVGENLALGYPSPEATMAGWMASPGHRENILRAYTAVGVGCVTGPDGALCSQVFLG